ncbi:SusC/RagA family TonB-linked outer membrane protein [Fodinibius sp. SL11]|uniref:SusC/RagA family TonB-linked outer membrane protein n=1 Tax=Fodinibius sp. SL11 TaxID=3425690 RepID=UPI003F882D24
MLRKLLCLIFFSVVFAGSSLAQGSISGTVTDARTGDTMPGVNVLITELERGAATGAEGNFEIQNVPSGTYTVRATFVGYTPYTTQVEVGSGEVTLNISLKQDVAGLEEVVVTGVGQGTQTKKLGFSVSKIGETELSEVPSTNVGSALYGKTSGISITSASGDPASSPSIRLRGSTSINGDQEPLVIVDGVITNGGLQDINMQDVESIEVVKGAAAASLYGSLAGNGVIQVITKKAGENTNKPSVTFRTEYGVSQIAKDYPVATTHPWVENATLTSDGNYIDSWPGYGQFDSDRTFDNEYPVSYDNVDAIFTGKAYNTNYVRLGGNSQGFNYSASYEGLTQGGVVEPLEDYKRHSIRFNAEYNEVERFTFSLSSSYVTSEFPYFNEQGQGANYFYSALTAPPYVSLLEKNADGSYTNNPTGYGVASSNWQNPLYVAENRLRMTDRDRIVGGLTVNYDLTDWLSVNARQSMDRRLQQYNDHTPVGYQTPTPSTFFNNGYEYIEDIDESTYITEVWAQFNQQIGEDINLDGTLKYLYEDRNYTNNWTQGYNYSVSGIRDIGATDPNNYSASSTLEEERVENYIANVDVDYQDKIIVGAMVRRDGSSLFGSEERWQTYYRGSLAYRLTEDIDINNVNELKLRASYGISGQRPPFDAQYETYTPTGTALAPNTLGNNEIKPSVVAETEFGLDATFLERFNFTANYAITNVTNDYLLVPLTGTSQFANQWQNVGEIENKSLEFTLGGQILSTKDLTWDANVSFTSVSQKVTDLGGAPAFTRGTGLDAAIDLFRFEEGVSYGAMYGEKLITSVDQLTVDDNGNVLNIAGGYSVEDFTTNELGHVVLEQDQGTQAERPMYLVDENGSPVITQIGDTQADFQVGFTSNFKYKGLSLFMVWDWSQGGDVYNYTRQLMYNRYLHQDLEDYTRSGLDPQYALANDGLYNGSEATSHFVEDASFVKLREASISYTVSNDMLGAIGDHIKSVKISAVGRNLLTFTDYSGYDPEVALRTNASNFRIDEFAYPNFRTFSGSIEVRL